MHLRRKIITVSALFLLVAGASSVYAETGKVAYLRAKKLFNRTQKEKNPRLAFRYLEEARTHAQSALTFDLSKEMKKKMTEIIELSEKFPSDALEAEYERAVANKIVIKWLKKDEVLQCLGKPDTIKREPFSREEEWAYKDDRLLYFKDDYLITIESSEFSDRKE